MSMPRELQPLLRRLKAQAHQQLLDEVAKLAAQVDALQAENDQLRSDLDWAQQTAESWSDEARALQDELAEQTGGTRGLTQTGHLVVIPSGAVQ